MSEKNIDDA